ncbi:MAG TPA: sulfatase-like hydrolase/transferase, partial [Polyangiaceae bacterium]|nr:sulfatase-like hydrolase/transferase [Polyangiaceae bacterium]
DPHDPYDLATREGSPFDRYLAEVALVDKHLARLFDALQRRGLAERTIVIVQADHGEAFGEHGSQTHGTTLYDEVLRVPLMFKIPGVAARRISTPVTTMDLGPTILETFGLAVPASFMGQSLVATLKGATPRLTRPIAAENRLQQTLVLSNGLKIIHDLRTKTNELYDLSKDPGETQDLSGNSELLAEPLATLQAFFEAHRYRAGGYQPPFIR